MLNTIDPDTDLPKFKMDPKKKMEKIKKKLEASLKEFEGNNFNRTDRDFSKERAEFFQSSLEKDGVGLRKNQNVYDMMMRYAHTFFFVMANAKRRGFLQARTDLGRHFVTPLLNAWRREDAEALRKAEEKVEGANWEDILSLEKRILTREELQEEFRTKVLLQEKIQLWHKLNQFLKKHADGSLNSFEQLFDTSEMGHDRRMKKPKFSVDDVEDAILALEMSDKELEKQIKKTLPESKIAKTIIEKNATNASSSTEDTSSSSTQSPAKADTVLRT